MFISKFWLILLTIAIGGLLAIALLAKDVINRERQESTTALLYKEMSKADIALNLHARKRLDVLLSVSGDGDVRILLRRASAGSSSKADIRDQLLVTLRNRNKALGKYTADMLIAVDKNGSVVAQVGKNERQHGQMLAGSPLVDAALRGYVRDDAWKLDNELYLMAARPVVDNGKYVGAVIHAIRVNDKTASEISPTTQLAFFAGSVPIAVGLPKNTEAKRIQGSYIVGEIDAVLETEQFKTNGYSKARMVTTADGDFLALYSLIRGEAAKNSVGYALVIPFTTMAAWTEIYESAGSQDVEALPSIWIILCILLAAALGIALIYFEGGRPLNNLLKHIQALEGSEPKDNLNIYQFRKKYRKIAGAINAAFNAKLQALGEVAEIRGSGKSIDAILGTVGEDRLSTAQFSFGDEVPPAPPAAAPAQAAPMQAAPAAPPMGPPAGPPAAPPAFPPNAPGAPPAAPGAVDQQAQYFRQIFSEFLNLKQRLGEPVEQFTFEKFEKTLLKNREAIITRYNCNQVLFQVYEKDGKAALKASPAK